MNHHLGFLLLPEYPLTADELLDVIDAESKESTRIGNPENSTQSDKEPALSALIGTREFLIAQRSHLDQVEQSAIDAARASGVTWREIGEVFGGISPQAAQSRYTESGRESTRRNNQKFRERYETVHRPRDLGEVATGGFDEEETPGESE